MSTSSYDNIVYTATMETMQYDAAVTSFADFNQRFIPTAVEWSALLRFPIYILDMMEKFLKKTIAFS